MQLFLTVYKRKADTIIIENAELLSQLRKVMRAKIGDTIRIQNPVNEAEKIRYEVRIDDRNEKELYGTICSQDAHHIDPQQITMIIAMPNKWDKAELIVQKLSEIGISKIIFRPAERSVIKERNSKKKERMEKIIKEAVEQSRGRKLPLLEFTTDLVNYLSHTHVVVFDKTPPGNVKSATWNIELPTGNHITGIIGPEVGLTVKDYKNFEPYTPMVVNLGETVLRMETAAIIAGRLLNNNAKL